MEDLLTALENKNPTIKAETALFIGRCFAKLTMANLPKKQLKAFCNSFLKVIVFSKNGSLDRIQLQ